jgi:hypothetical protein
MVNSKWPRKITGSDIKRVLEESEKPVMMAQGISDEIDATDVTVRRRAKEAVEEGIIEVVELSAGKAYYVEKEESAPKSAEIEVEV